MPNYNYLKGVRKERKLVNDARAQGFLAFRSAGSHSPIDVVIIDPEHETIKLVQCKPDDMPEQEKYKLKCKYADLTGLFVVHFEVE